MHYLCINSSVNRNYGDNGENATNYHLRNRTKAPSRVSASMPLAQKGLLCAHKGIAYFQAGENTVPVPPGLTESCHPPEWCEQSQGKLFRARTYRAGEPTSSSGSTKLGHRAPPSMPALGFALLVWHGHAASVPYVGIGE